MNARRLMVSWLVYIFIGIVSLSAFAQGPEDKNSPPRIPGIYAGMPKKDIYKVYGSKLQLQYERNDNQEIMVFDDALTSEPGDVVVFYLKAGRLEEWERQYVEPSPEQILKVIRQRGGRAANTPQGDDKLSNDIMRLKEHDRMRDTMRLDRKDRYLKERLKR